MSGGTHIVPLDDTHNLESFSSGDDELDLWLVKRARKAEAERTARTFVLIEGDRVIGYYALAAGAIERRWLPGPMRRNSPDPIPGIILARLAVHSSDQGLGHGRRMLADVVIRSLTASAVIGAKLLLVHVEGDETAAYYERFRFARCPGNTNTLFLALSDIADAIE